eukprot:TRINITY_DN5849_c0_g1_i1.p1 TRINITY_DN5849_c0_g1~~TRINITY_DN5849_c0_g1_i1.p1  ORF type:complete len:254 (-),score=47.74 TRINITY_DN5849_c0_g1_i1:84-845(-)
MCSTSKLGSLPPLGGSSDGATMAPAVSAAMVKVNLERYTLVDIREPGEEGSAPPGAQAVTMGKLFSFAHDKRLAEFEWFDTNKTILVLCTGGVRAAATAAKLVQSGYQAAYVTRGLLEWDSPAATKPGLVVILTTTDVEKVTLAMLAAKTSQGQGTQTVFIGMGKGVEVFRNVGVQGCTEADVVTGMKAEDPFPPVLGAWNAFKAAGGVTLLCTTCVKSRKLDAVDVQDGAILFNMPDLLRMQQESPANLQFG